MEAKYENTFKFENDERKKINLSRMKMYVVGNSDSFLAHYNVLSEIWNKIIDYVLLNFPYSIRSSHENEPLFKYRKFAEKHWKQVMEISHLFYFEDMDLPFRQILNACYEIYQENKITYIIKGKLE